MKKCCMYYTMFCEKKIMLLPRRVRAAGGAVANEGERGVVVEPARIKVHCVLFSCLLTARTTSHACSNYYCSRHTRKPN